MGCFDLRHFLSADRRLARCLRRTSDSQGADGDLRAGLDVRGHRLFKQDVRVEHSVSVALLVFKRESSSEEGSAEETAAEKREGMSVRRLRRKVTSGKACAASGEGRSRSRVTKK